MKKLRARLLQLAAVVALAAASLWVLGGATTARADGPVQITIKITDAGFVPDTVDVPEGAQVELTFIWDSPAHPKDEHIIVVPGFKLESEKVDTNNKQTIIKFVANKSGAFNFKCDFECDTHDILQHGTINVKPAAGGAGTAGSAALTPSKIVIDPATGVLVKGNSVSIAAALQDKDGKPISKSEVAFFADRQFLGRHGEVPIFVGKTDANGNIFATYHPTNSDGGKLIARYEGAGIYDKTELAFNLAGSPQFQPIPLAGVDDNLHGIKRGAPYALVAIIASIWIAFAFMLYQAWGISRARSGGSQSPKTH